MRRLDCLIRVSQSFATRLGQKVMGGGQAKSGGPGHPGSHAYVCVFVFLADYSYEDI